MGKEAMVTPYVAESTRLVGHLKAAGSPITAAILAHDVDVDLWRLLLAVPRSSSQSKAELYTQAQTAIEELGLSISLSQITSILDTEPLVPTLRSVVEDSFTNVVEISVGGADLGGNSVDRVVTFSVDAISYEEEVFSALQRVRPADADLRRSGSLSIYDEFDFDFILSEGPRTTIIETKSVRRPLVGKDIQRISAIRDMVSYQQASLIIVAKNGFNLVPNWLSDYSQQLVGLRQILLVKWNGKGDDQELSTALSLSIME